MNKQNSKQVSDLLRELSRLKKNENILNLRDKSQTILNPLKKSVKLIERTISFWTEIHADSIVKDYAPELKTNAVLLDKSKVFDNEDNKIINAKLKDSRIMKLKEIYKKF